MLAVGQWDPRALYILGSEEVKSVLAKSDPERDMLASINGHIVFAPSWFTCAACPSISETLLINLKMVQTQLGQAIGFDTPGNGKYFLQGPNWAYPESWGVWAVGQRAQLTLPLPVLAGAKAKLPTQLTLVMRALVNTQNTTQEIGISVNGQKPQKFTLNKDDRNQVVISLNDQVIKDGYVQLIFDLPNAKRPKDIGIGRDDRLLSIGLISAQFY
jgi:hypothetical protein